MVGRTGDVLWQSENTGVAARSLRWRVEQLRRNLHANIAAFRVRHSRVRLAELEHRLGGRLIVSLTSYPPRFSTLALTLKCLLSQSVRADETILWIAEGAMAALPDDVLALKAHGLTVRVCEELGSYKKIIPALEKYPDAFIATADDDRDYPRGWLAALVAGQRERPGSIVCHRARVMQLADDGSLLPYRSWRYAASDDTKPLMPTGFGGVLYPPHSLAAEVTDRATFREISPHADDLWLKWMSAAVGTPVHLVTDDGPSPYDWPDSQRVSLLGSNVHAGGNDQQAAALSERFGTAHLMRERNSAGQSAGGRH